MVPLIKCAGRSWHFRLARLVSAKSNSLSHNSGHSLLNTGQGLNMPPSEARFRERGGRCHALASSTLLYLTEQDRFRRRRDEGTARFCELAAKNRFILVKVKLLSAPHLACQPLGPALRLHLAVASSRCQKYGVGLQQKNIDKHGYL